jgi:tetratricopeptide (TPR) repeat protein
VTATRIPGEPGGGGGDRTERDAPAAGDPAEPADSLDSLDTGAPTLAMATPGPGPLADASPSSIARDLGSMADVLGEVAGDPPPPLVAGDVIGERYVVERALGAGGMGVVYAARDTQLDRRVAIKLGTRLEGRELARLEREAIAIAQLSHPNVVHVYEIGRYDHRVFLAMEYVDGGTVRAWLAERARTAAEVARVFAAIADGLAAAHAAGLVHRDVKPENLLLGTDGRPRIADFGVALALGRGDGDDAGAGAGTPAYMAPEQRGTAAVDARADQFSFAVAMWEALHGVRPLPSEHHPRAAAIAAGELRGARAVPGSIDRALRRALRAAPDQRWPDMAALARALRVDPSARRRRLAIGGAALAVAGAAIAATAVWAGGTAPPACDGGPAELARSWSPARADAIAAAFAAVPGGVAQATAVRNRLDGWAARWVDTYAAACRATHVDGAQSAQILDGRMACLRRTRHQAEVVIDEVVASAAGLGDRLSRLLDTIGAPADCDAAEAAGDPLPADPERRRAVERIEADLATATARVVRDPLAEHRARLDGVIATAEAAKHAPTLARALLVDAALCRDALEIDCALAAAKRAFDLATTARNDELAITAAATAVKVLIDRRRLDEATGWVDISVALGKRVADNARLQMVVLRTQAALAESRGDYPGSAAFERRAAELSLASNPTDEQLGDVYRNRGNAAIRAQRTGDAVADFERAIEAYDRAGIAPEAIAVRNNLGMALAALGKVEEMCKVATDAVARAESWFGPEHAGVAKALSRRARCEMMKGDLAAAVPIQQRVVALYTAALGPEGRDLSAATADLASSHCLLGATAACAAVAADAVRAIENLDDPRPHAHALVIQGAAETELGHFDAAEQIFVRARAVIAPNDEPSLDLVDVLVEHAHLEVARKPRRDPRALLARAVAICDDVAPTPMKCWDPRLSYARELARARAPRAEVRVQAEAALADLRELHPDQFAVEIAEAEALAK